MSLFGSSETPRFPSPARAFSLFKETAAHRADLAALELGEAGVHARLSLLLAAAVALFALLGGFALTLMLAGLVWDSPHRAWWLAGICLAYLAAGAAAAFALRHRLRTWSPFHETRNQLNHDHACLNRLIQSILP